MVFSSNGSTTTAIPILNNSHFFICRENMRKAKLSPPSIFVGFQSRFSREFTLPAFKRTYFLSSPFHTSPVKKRQLYGKQLIHKPCWKYTCITIYQIHELRRNISKLTSASYSALVLFDIFEYYEAYKTKLGMSNLCLYHIHRSLVLESLKDCHRISILILKVQPWKLLATRFFLGRMVVWS